MKAISKQRADGMLGAQGVGRVLQHLQPGHFCARAPSSQQAAGGVVEGQGMETHIHGVILRWDIRRVPVCARTLVKQPCPGVCSPPVRRRGTTGAVHARSFPASRAPGSPLRTPHARGSGISPRDECCLVRRSFIRRATPRSVADARPAWHGSRGLRGCGGATTSDEPNMAVKAYQRASAATTRSN